ncbi:MAG: aminotransferase class III-fold pyridoxal phosphate-dependent enzyme [Rhodoferax sp.]|nr:aminotransferase class III-fold pyridoxal phosphate-dependent enzyme [Rhodoferax sp.]
MDRAAQLLASATEVLPGGVSASARANTAIGRPFFVSRGDGAWLYDLDGRRFLDMCTSHGASLLGHNHPRIKAAVQSALEMGVLCACETEYQTRLAERLRAMVPCAEMSRFAGSGTETVMHGLRLARTATGRHRFIKFEGHFHGYADALNYSVMPPPLLAGPADHPLPYPESGGMPQQNAADVIVVPFNDPQALRDAFATHGAEVAALLMEPVNYDQGCIEPAPGFAELCRELCDAYGALLFFDEVLTAFRIAPGGAQHYLGVTPDLCVLGKALGAGMPISALSGRRSVMRHLKPLGMSQMSGTYLAHLTGVMAALAALDEYAAAGLHARMADLADHFCSGVTQRAAACGAVVRVQHLGPRFGLYFGLRDPVTNYREAACRDLAAEEVFIRSCFAHGVFFQPSAHHGFSAVHTLADIDFALEAAQHALRDVQRFQQGGA